MSFKNLAMRLTAGILCVTAMAAPALAVAGTVNTGSSKLNLRAEASTASSVVTKIPGGSSVEVLNTNTVGWYQISFSGMTGYVASQYVDLAQETAAPATQTAPAAEPVYGRITTSTLNIRSGPSTDHEKCGKLRAGKVVEILETLNGWYRIEGGYISADYVTLVDASALTASSIAEQAVDLALSYVGYPYVYGGSSPKGFDCSGFTSYIYKQFGISLNRTCSGQLDNGTPVSMSELLPGDLVIFKKYANSNKRASHVGLYIGNGQFVHASTAKVGVIVSSLSDAYYTTGFVGGRRVV